MSPVKMPGSDLPYFARFLEGFPVPSPAPHKCPVCDGRGSMARSFYDPNWYQAPNYIGGNTEPCRSCDGRGIVWKP